MDAHVMTCKHMEIWLSLEFMIVAKSGFLPGKGGPEPTMANTWLRRCLQVRYVASVLACLHMHVRFVACTDASLVSNAIDA